MNPERSLVCRTQKNIRMAGFLEKKGKMKLISQWKKYWFVLEERLLLYYRSEIEYTNLSPCRGSLNMGLVSTVCPGSSTGPCVIHVITRTQVVQLRAKNRAMQEKWLEALLHSMSLPIVTKPLKPPSTKSNFLGYGCSLDNIHFKGQLQDPGRFENEWTFPRKLDYRKRQISGTIFGGSLDTAIWSTKIKPARTPSPNIAKGKLLEKLLGFSKESDYSGSRSKESRFSLCDEDEMKFVGKNLDTDEMCDKNLKCKVHEENRNHDLYSVVDKKKKKIKKTLSDPELNKMPDVFLSLESTKTERKDGSPFERIKNALTRIPKDSILKGKPVGIKRSRLPKKRRQSFLQKVFKKGDSETHECEPDSNDPLYDTIKHIQEETRNSISAVFRQGNAPTTSGNPHESLKNVESLYAEVQKTVIGSRIILPPKTMSELKSKLKSRESVNEENTAPSLPPRRVSRAISPWHDIPTNNARVDDARYFSVHQTEVKFNDSIPPIDFPKSESELSDIESDLRFDVTEPTREICEPATHEKKNDDLSVLLEQLTKITVAPLAEPEVTDDNYNSSSDSEKVWPKSHFSEPDYDVPRPHRPMSILISEEKEIISSTGFMGKCDNNSDTSSSFRSMEPDSLEMSEKKSSLIC